MSATTTNLLSVTSAVKLHGGAFTRSALLLCIAEPATVSSSTALCERETSDLRRLRLDYYGSGS